MRSAGNRPKSRSAVPQRATDGELDSRTYNTRYDELLGRQNQMHPAGVSLRAIGGAGLILAVVLFAIDTPNGYATVAFARAPSGIGQAALSPNTRSHSGET